MNIGIISHETESVKTIVYVSKTLFGVGHKKSSSVMTALGTKTNNRIFMKAVDSVCHFMRFFTPHEIDSRNTKAYALIQKQSSVQF